MHRDTQHNLPVLACCAAEIVNVMLKKNRRVMLYGPPGIGKSTLAAQIAHELMEAGQSCHCICADPGSPAFGVPGTVSLGRWQQDGWRVCAYEAICSLDAGRFRLPLVSAVWRLAQSLSPSNGVLLIDTPGVVRGVAGSELLQGLFEATAVDAVLILAVADRPLSLFEELRTLAAQLYVVHAVAEARRPGKRSRARQRTKRWDDYLKGGSEQTIDLNTVNLIGTPPPVGEASAWTGRQIALLNRNQIQAMAEVVGWQDNQLIVSLPHARPVFDSVLVRDAQRSINGLVETAAPFAAERLEYLPPFDLTVPVERNGGPRVIGRVGSADFCLVNGVFGDPLLQIRLRHQRRNLLFDVGGDTRLPARTLHQVTDVFISHAHIDHIGGFMMLLRARIGQFPPCRLYGPPGLAQHIAGFLQSILWDRVAERAPCFEVAELHANRLLRFRLRAGQEGCEPLDEVEIKAGIILQDVGFCVRAQLLDHHTPVLAYAFEPAKEINVRKERLQARGLEPGPWLGMLKAHLLAKNETALVALPDGTERRVSDLAADLMLIKPGKKLVYATDLANTRDNRQRLQTLAQYAHTFFCEAYFIEADAKQAAQTGHLTTRACGEIAMAAEVARLVPFHFSQRYADRPQQIYDEVHAVCPRVVMPPSIQRTAVANDTEAAISSS